MIQGEWRRGLCVLAVLLILATGCQSKSKPAVSDAKDAAAKEAEQAPQGPTTYRGKWALIVTQQMADQNGQPTFRDVHLMLFEIKEDAEGPKAEVLATLEGAPQFSIQSLKIDGDACTIELKANENTIEYQGTLKGGIVRGTMLVEGGGGVAPAMLQPTTHTSFDTSSWDATPVTPGADALIKALGDKNQPMATLEIAAALRGNPLSLEAFASVFGRLASLPTADEKSLKMIAVEYLDSGRLWGPRMAEQVRATVILNTVGSRKYPRIAQEWLDDVREPNEKISAAGLKNFGEAFDAARDQVAIDIALEDLRSDDAAVAKAAYETLETKLATQRYNPELLHALATYAAKHDMADKATEYWGDIVALPLLEGFWIRSQQGKPPGDGSPRELLLKLWEDKHGNVEGFDAFLADTYHRRMTEMADAARKAATAKVTPEKGRPVLLELFTGATCPPCIASDIALDLVSQDYPAPQVIALRYHQHIPGPDPLANQDTEDRFGYYEGTGTPMLLMDGRVPNPGIGGMLQHVNQAYAALRKGVDERLKTTSDIQVQATAVLENNEITVEASAVGWPEDKAKRLRLRIALVENDVEYLAPNGIRSHAHLVRTMVGGAKGTAVKSGQLAVSTKLSLTDLKQSLTEYLDQFEKNRGVEFPVKPLALTGLSVVAWVQNDEDREVLSTVIVPVSGSDVASPSPTPATDAPASATAPANANP